MFRKLNWERVEETLADGQPKHHGTYRTAVPGGWLIAIWSDGAGQHGSAWGGGVTFVPDPEHKWVADTQASPR
jgi:hypothetical protein